MKEKLVLLLIMCVVYWKNLLTGFVGHGSPISCENAYALVASTHVENFIHWVVKL
ncbi:MAG: hypothetical protein GY931_11480 [Maribacter sp.]|nr:hypothetical protein [Maribacter sp.]